MSRLWTAGNELQSAAAGIEFTAITTNAPAVETTTKRSGNAAWRISNTSAAEGFRLGHSSSQGAFYFRFYLYIVALPTSTSVIGGARITGSSKISIRLTTGGALQLYNTEDSAQVGSNSSNLSTATWYRIEMTYDSTTLASTTCSARIDGTEFASGTVDLAATPTSFGCYTIAGDATLDYIVDDLAINDTSGSFQNSWPGEGEVIILRPNGNGDNSAWGGSDGNSTDNYLLVDETPPDSTDYVESNTSGQIDDYALEATPSALESTDEINAVHVGVYAATNDATGGDPDLTLRIKDSGGNLEESASLDCNSVTYQGPAPAPAINTYQLTLYNLPGASTSPWTKTELDGAQVGVRESATDTHFARVAAIWVMVDHKPGIGAQTISPSAIASAEAFGTDRLDFTLLPSAIASLEAFGSLAVNLTLLAEAVASLEAFGAARLDFTLLSSAIASAEAFGSPAIVPGEVTISPSAIASGEAFGTSTITLTISPSGITSLEAFGSHQLDLTLLMTGITSAEAFGTSTLTLFIAPSGVASLEAFGDHSVSVAGLGDQTLSPSAIASLEAFGTAILSLTLNPSSIASLEAFGASTLTLFISPSGIATLETFGTAQLDLALLLTGLASAEAFGSHAILPGAVTISPSGIASVEAFGSTLVSLVILASASASAEAFGSPTITPGAVTISPSGVISVEAFGDTIILGGGTIQFKTGGVLTGPGASGAIKGPAASGSIKG